MPVIATPVRLLAAALLAATLAACASGDKRPAELSDEQVCLDHFKNDPVERERCHLSGENRQGSPPDLDPHQLPVRTPGPGDIN